MCKENISEDITKLVLSLLKIQEEIKLNIKKE